MDNETTSFFDYYHIKVLDSNKRFVNAVKRVFFSETTDKEIVNDEITQIEEPLYTITIPKSDLEKLIKLDHIAFNKNRHTYKRDLFSAMMEQKQLERYYQTEFPAVKDAFEKYSMLLHLVSNGNYRNPED